VIDRLEASGRTVADLPYLSVESRLFESRT
jgi:hypothetical protein